MTVREILADIRSDRKKKVILDTDTYNEVDDQFALAYCYLSDRIDLIGVNAAPFMLGSMPDFGRGMELSYKEILNILSMTDPDYTTPVFRGSKERIFIKRSYIDSPACDNIIKTVHESDEIVYVLAIGCITNVASALMKDPSIKDNMAVIWLGSNALDFEGGNITEYNLYQDLTASQHLIDCGVPLLLCPAKYVTYYLDAPIETFRQLKGRSQLCDYLVENVEKCYEAEGKPENWTRIIWDLAAPAMLDVPECAEIEVITAPRFTDDCKYAYDPSRHEMLYLKKIDRDIVFKKVWELLKTVK